MASPWYFEVLLHAVSESIGGLKGGEDIGIYVLLSYPGVHPELVKG